jgi:hypothetical protein
MDAPPAALKSRRPLSLTYNIPIEKTKQFWEGLKAGRLLTTKCRACGTLTFPPQADCPKCHASDVEWVELGNEAQLESFTQIHVPPATFVQHDPYVVAVGRLPNGLRVLAWLAAAEPRDLRVGVKMRLVPRSTPEGTPYYDFELVSGSPG